MRTSSANRPWAVLLITKVEQEVLIQACDDDIICTWMAGTSTSPCKGIKERHWHLCSPHSLPGLLTARWLILSFLMSVNRAMPDKESVSSWCWRAHLSFRSSPWPMPNMEPEVAVHFRQKRVCVCWCSQSPNLPFLSCFHSLSLFPKLL